MEQLLISQMSCGVRRGKYLSLHPHIEPKTIQGPLGSQCWCAMSAIRYVCDTHSSCSSGYLPNAAPDFHLLKENGLLSVLNLVTSALIISRLLLF